MSWQSLKIKFRQSTIDTLLVVWLDGGRLVVVQPDVGILRSDSSRPLSYYCLIENTIAGRVQNLFATGLPLTADPYSLNAFYKSVVLFRSEDEKNNLESLLAERIDDVESLMQTDRG